MHVRFHYFLSYRVWVTEPHDELPIKMGTEGVTAEKPLTVFEVFQRTVEEHGEKPALSYKDTSTVRFFFF